MSLGVCRRAYADLRRQGALCDVLIRVRDAEFPAHRIVLCGCSEFFREIFCNKSSPSQPQHQVFTFHQVSPDVMSLILDYVYTHEIHVTEENILDILAGAKLFAIAGIIKACCDFLEQRLCLNNCVNIWTLADFHSCPDLRQKAEHLVLDGFEEVMRSSEMFLKLSVDQLAGFLEQDELNVPRERVVLEAVIRWVAHSPQERRRDMITLLRKVRLLLMSDVCLSEALTNSLLRECPECVTMVTDAIQTILESMFESSKPPRPLTPTRLPPAVILAIAGSAKDSTNNCSPGMELYDVRADRWVSVNVAEAPSSFHGTVFLGGSVYCVGGFNGGKYLNSVQKLDLATKTWQEAGSMHTARCYVSVVVLNGGILAMGGFDGRERLKSVERFQPDANQWTTIAPMHEYRSDASAATLSGKVYICGGFDKAEPLCSAECYNPQTNQWTWIAAMDVGYNGTRAIAYRDRIYVVGGFRGVWHTCRVIAYEPVCDRWTLVSPVATERSRCGVAVLEGRLYVAGGIHRHGAVRTVERYDATTNRWSRVQDMETPRSNFSCCVVERNPFTAALL